MQLGLSNVKLSLPGSGVSRTGVKKVNSARPSIAEDAIFIPKPRKRVQFELKQPEFRPLGSGGGPSGGDIPLLGEKKGAPEVNIEPNLNNAGELGPNGLTARITKETYQSVEVVVNNLAEKDFKVIATQEEGRQINHEQIHHTLQVDSYGRPIIGFSREPYDFAAIKFMSITSQVRFQQNMERTRESFEEYFLGPSGESGIEEAADPTKLPESPFTMSGKEKKGVSLPESPFKTENTDFDPTELPVNPFTKGSVFAFGKKVIESTYDAPTAKELADQQKKAGQKSADAAAQSLGDGPGLSGVSPSRAGSSAGDTGSPEVDLTV
jgi:hypothetical protein